MYHQNGIVYNEKHTISFGNVSNNTFSQVANTWTTWHLIPASRPAVAAPQPNFKFVEIPGRNGQVDFSDFLTGSPQYGQRVGNFSFFIARGFQDIEVIHQNMSATLHGKKLKMKLQDDPTYYYEGRFTVGNLETGGAHPMVTIGYTLEPYKRKINPAGTGPAL